MMLQRVRIYTKMYSLRLVPIGLSVHPRLREWKGIAAAIVIITVAACTTSPVGKDGQQTNHPQPGTAKLHFQPPPMPGSINVRPNPLHEKAIRQDLPASAVAS